MVSIEAIRQNEKGVCPHCGTTVQFLCCEEVAVAATSMTPNIYRDAISNIVLGDGKDTGRTREAHISLRMSRCPECNRAVVVVQSCDGCHLAWPRCMAREPLHASVPDELVKDYDEAVLVLSDSPNASAALSRRCLQTLLVKQGAKKGNLVDQIDELKATLPFYIQKFVDNIRAVGNLAAHAKQDAVTAEIVDVEPHEGEWLIDLLEMLFDHYYAKPAQAVVRQDALNQKMSGLKKLSNS